ncbi:MULTISPECIES: flagellar export protein FliJ [Microbulbifer]|uniref:Flagellar FliJ protein n=1 Tax=Microbulbifer celer TaxID=435905 RepID=A0ABW3U434_9GAMM|nr:MULTISPECIES: flagellar export protein FliJ [Microbulbifer]UFN57837.1 flagellar export protein FliJ [Microbulbifer celer]
MNHTNPLDTLIEQSRKARDNAGRALASERQSREQTAGQLETLQRYRSEYCERLQQAMRQGIDAATLDDYNRFIRSLETAIQRARDVLSQQQERVESSSAHWRQRQRELSSFSALESRRTQQEQQREQRRERLLADEMTQNLLARRPAADEYNPS